MFSRCTFSHSLIQNKFKLNTNFNNLLIINVLQIILISYFLSVSDKKNILSELYDNNFEMLLKKEKRSVELKKQSIDDTSTIFKVKYCIHFNSLGSYN